MAKVMAKTVKLADIAAIVNVSTVTVSKALSDQKGVSEEMRARIKQLAKEMGYQTPTAARLSSNKRTYNIGVLILLADVSVRGNEGGIEGMLYAS